MCVCCDLALKPSQPLSKAVRQLVDKCNQKAGCSLTETKPMLHGTGTGGLIKGGEVEVAGAGVNQTQGAKDRGGAATTVVSRVFCADSGVMHANCTTVLAVLKSWISERKADDLTQNGFELHTAQASTPLTSRMMTGPLAERLGVTSELCLLSLFVRSVHPVFCRAHAQCNLHHSASLLCVLNLTDHWIIISTSLAPTSNPQVHR